MWTTHPINGPQPPLRLPPTVPQCKLVSAIVEPIEVLSRQNRKRRRMVKRLVGLLVIGTLVLAACGAQEDAGPDLTIGESPGSAVGPGISIGDALNADPGQPLLVNGFLFVDTEGAVSLVSLMAESLPPIPGGDQVLVEGLDLGEYRLSESQGLRWTDDLVQVLGILNGNTLTVSNTLSG